MSKVLNLLLASLLAAAVAKSETPAVPVVFPFAPSWDDATPSATNISSWLESPAGKQGFIAAREGHLTSGKKRIRFLGVNFSGGANFPVHEDADKIAARLAKFGIGCVRLQQLDSELLPKDAIGKLDPEKLDKLDYLISALKAKGIYVDLCLHSSRVYPGMPEWDFMPDNFKGVDNFYAGMIEQQRAFARDLLTHVNPYTKVPYVNEPAVAFVEINNQSSLVNEWWKGSLDNMPGQYSDELLKLWRAWLFAKYGTEEKLRAVWNAHETPEGNEMLGDERGGWLEQGRYPTGVKSTPVPEKLLFSNSAIAQAAAIEEAKAKKAGNSTPATPKLATVPAVWLHVTPGKETWEGTFVRQKVPLDSQTAYTFSLEAKCDRPRVLTVTARDLGAWSYKEADVVKAQLTLSADWKKQSLTFVPKKSIVDAQFGLTDLAGAISDWYFADLSLKPAAIQGLRPDEKIGTVSLFYKRDFLTRTPEARKDWITFLINTEIKYWSGMARYLKEDLRLRSLVIGTPVNQSPFPIQSQLDVVAVNGSWQPPRFPHKPSDPVDWKLQNISMVSEIDGGEIGRMAAQRVAGKPFICTQFSAAAPNTYSSEAFLLLGAYAALQDWDAIFADGYTSDLNSMKSGMFGNFFDIAQHPSKMATLPAVHAMFVRGDVLPATPQIVSVSKEQVLDQICKNGPSLSASQFGARPEQTLSHPVQLTLDGTAVAGVEPVQSVFPGVTSDTLDLRWDRRAAAGVVTIDTEKSAGVIGFGTDVTFPLMQVSITPRVNSQNWATVNLTVMEGADFKTAKRVLITASGYAANTNMTLSKDKESITVGDKWGKAPSVVEGVSATITFPLMPGAKVWALDEAGKQKTEVPFKTIDGKSILEIGPEWKTLWYEIEGPK